ncbi:MAG: hypothetical protein EHM47_13885, partial [Ignavibacteriales bacterium]
MEFLDKLVLPQSAEHIELLHYMVILVLALFIPFISIILGGTTLSLYFRKKGIEAGNPFYLKFAKDIIELVTINKSVGIILGIVPLLTCILVFAQLLHTASVSTITYLVIAFILITVSLILIYTYRYSLSFTNIFNSIKEVKSEDAELKEELEKFRKGNQSLSMRSGRYGILLLYLAVWIFTAAITLAVYTKSWGSDNFLISLFSWRVLSNFIQLISAAFALTGGAILFGFFYWEGGKKNLTEDYKNFVLKTSARIALTAALLLPLFLLISLLSLPDTALSFSVFSYSFIALFLLFLAYHYLYALLREPSVKYTGRIFYIILFSIIALIAKDQLAMGNATKVHSSYLVADFNKYLADLKGTSTGAEVLSGREIYEIRCASCHRFDQKLVGPPYNSTLPKYENKIDALVTYILNPVKVDPAYPPMPNPGLRPAEAKAVADYEMIEHMKLVFSERSAEAGDNGEMLFNRICAACHSFEEDMVGPAFNNVITKYVDKQDELIAFISNPQKISPEFPEMPNPGL